ncbi:ABC transporter permease subunit [Nocardioides sp. 616]|uniref:ABC transporter permease subunit n=1 Tax=Nocardioides sp. 616 TaxID=2268090 RepID=UPI001966057D|nr:ABC transporter permease subunit [Nocardioides sp. 616]
MVPSADAGSPAGDGGEHTGVIHDIGYRHYDGPRLGERYVQRSLFLDSLRGAYGLGRSARSKVMPMLLLAVMCLPAVVMVVVTSMIRADELPVTYREYPFEFQVVVAIFVAGQAPVLVSRDLRFRVVPLYFARPLGRAAYVQAKLAAMVAAVLVLLVVPVTILFVGALLLKQPLADELPDFLVALVVCLGYAVLLSGLALLIAALTPRRGLGVAAVITVLLVLSGVQSAIRGIATEYDEPALADYSGLISPPALVDELAGAVIDGSGSWSIGLTGTLVYAAVAVTLVLGAYLALLLRYRRVPTS